MTETDSSLNDTRVINFIKEYDDDNDGFVTLDGFLLFYEKATLNKDEDVWKNLKHAGFRYDLRKVNEL